MTDSQIIATLQGQIAAQAQHILVLEEKLITLLDLRQKQGVKKDSHNSSLPPLLISFPELKACAQSPPAKQVGNPVIRVRR